MTLELTDAQSVLLSAILGCRSHDELTLCACQIHQVCPSHSEAESELISKAAIVGVALDMQQGDWARN